MRDGRVLVQYRGIPFDWRKRVATMALNPSIPWAIEVVGGINRIEADLLDLDLRRFEVTGADRAGPARVRPAARRGADQADGRHQDHPGRASERRAGPGRDLGRRGAVEVDGQMTGHAGRQDLIESRGWSSTGDRYLLEIIGGTKTVTIVERPKID